MNFSSSDMLFFAEHHFFEINYQHKCVEPTKKCLFFNFDTLPWPAWAAQPAGIAKFFYMHMDMLIDHSGNKISLRGWPSLGVFLCHCMLKENRRTDRRHFATVWTGLIRGRPNQSILASLSLNPTIPVADKFMKSWPARWTSWLIQKDEGQPGKPKFSVSHSHYFLPQQHLHGRLGSWERIQVSKNQCQAFRQKQAAGNLSGKSLLGNVQLVSINFFINQL